MSVLVATSSFGSTYLKMYCNRPPTSNTNTKQKSKKNCSRFSKFLLFLWFLAYSFVVGVVFFLLAKENMQHCPLPIHTPIVMEKRKNATRERQRTRKPYRLQWIFSARSPPKDIGKNANDYDERKTKKYNCSSIIKMFDLCCRQLPHSNRRNGSLSLSLATRLVFGNSLQLVSLVSLCFHRAIFRMFASVSRAHSGKIPTFFSWDNRYGFCPNWVIFLCIVRQIITQYTLIENGFIMAALVDWVLLHRPTAVRTPRMSNFWYQVID